MHAWLLQPGVAIEQKKLVCLIGEEELRRLGCWSFDLNCSGMDWFSKEELFGMDGGLSKY